MCQGQLSDVELKFGRLSSQIIGMRNKSPFVLTTRPATILLGHSGRSVVVVFKNQLRPIQTQRNKWGASSHTVSGLTTMEWWEMGKQWIMWNKWAQGQDKALVFSSQWHRYKHPQKNYFTTYGSRDTRVKQSMTRAERQGICPPSRPVLILFGFVWVDAMKGDYFEWKEN